MEKKELRKKRARILDEVFRAEYQGRQFQVHLKATKENAGLIESSVNLTRGRAVRLMPDKTAPEDYQAMVLLGQVTKPHTTRSFYEVQWARLSSPSGFRPLVTYMKETLDIELDRKNFPLGEVMPDGTAVYSFDDERVRFPDHAQGLAGQTRTRPEPEPAPSQSAPGITDKDMSEVGQSGFAGERTPIPQPEEIVPKHLLKRKQQQSQKTISKPEPRKPAPNPKKAAPDADDSGEILLPMAGQRPRTRPSVEEHHNKTQPINYPETPAADETGRVSVYGVDIREEDWESLDNLHFAGESKNSTLNRKPGPRTQPITKDRINDSQKKERVEHDRKAAHTNSQDSGVGGLLRKIAHKLADKDDHA